MIADYIQSVAKSAIKISDFLLIDNEEFSEGFNKRKCMFLKNSGLSFTILELHNLDEYTDEEFEVEIMEKTTNIMKIFESPVDYKIFKVFIGHGNDSEKRKLLMRATHLHQVAAKKFVKPIYVNIDEKTVSRLYKGRFPDKDIIVLLGENVTKKEYDKFDVSEIEKLNLDKQQEYRVEIMTTKSTAVYVLILLNIMVYLVARIKAFGMNTGYLETLYNFGIKDNELIRNGQYYRLFAPVFLHAGILHLLINCYALRTVGKPCENIYGNLKFLCIYLLSGLGGCIASFAFSNSLSLGASGAIFGILGATLYFQTQKPVAFRTIFGGSLISVIILNLILGFTTEGIDNCAHIGGLIAGFLLAGIFRYKKEDKWYIRDICLIAFIAIFGGMLYLGFK